MLHNRISIKEAVIFFAFVFSLVVAGCSQQPVKYYQKLKYSELGDIEIPDIERVTLANGMQLLLMEDHELPLINASAMIRTGSAYEPADKIGLADITGSVMRTGGTTNKTGDQIDEELEQIAASVGTSIGVDAGRASMSVLKEDVDAALEIFADVLMNPAFPQDKIELAKIQHRSGIARRNDNMSQIASREYQKLIYGPQSVYARQTEYATIDNVTRDDLVAFHKKYYHPNNMILAVWGDFDTNEMIKKITQTFKDWEKADIEPEPMPEVTYDFEPTVNVISKDDVHQSCIYMGHIGGLLSDPDYFPLILMNQILGSGFTSRLFKNVRSREGLAYSVSGGYGCSYIYPGVFSVRCQTKSESTLYAIRAMSKEVKKMTEEEVTDEEINLARQRFINTFVFNFDSKGRIIQRLLTYEYFGYPADFLQKIKTNVEKVTKADILRVARKHLKPDKMQILAVGRPEDFDQPLSILGPVREIDVTIPSP